MMNKAEFITQPSEERLQETRNKATELHGDQIVARVFSQKGIPPACIDKSPWKINEWRKNFQPCVNCPGLAKCGQKQKGYFESLSYDGYLSIELSPCKYMREHLKSIVHLDRFLVNDMPQKLSTVSFESILTSDSSLDEQDEYIDFVVKAMTLSGKNRSLYIYGPLGTGKTYLAACACNAHAKKGERVGFAVYPDLCRRLTTMVTSGEFKVAISDLIRTDFLVLDDFGAESVTEWNRDQILFPVLNARYEAKKTTWFTSNLDMESLHLHFRFTSKGIEDEIKASRIIERISSMADILPLRGDDRRKIS